jgi:site-specific recombinase XerD
MHREVFTLEDLRERHARLARIANKSEQTIKWYQTAITGFRRYLDGLGSVAAPARLSDFTLEAVRDYILYLRGRAAFADHPFLAPRPRGLSDTSINCYVRALRAFASWLYEQEYTDTNLLGRLKAPTVTRRAIEILSDAEIARVLDVLATPTATNARNRAIFLTLLDTGARARDALVEAIHRAVEGITREDAVAWFTHAGYDLPDQGN